MKEDAGGYANWMKMNRGIVGGGEMLGWFGRREDGDGANHGKTWDLFVAVIRRRLALVFDQEVQCGRPSMG